MINVFEIHHLFKINNLQMIYNGEFNQDLIKSILILTEKKFTEGSDKVFKNKIFGVIVECLQNIERHSAKYDGTDSDSEVGSAILVLGKDNNDFVISTGNLIQNSRVDMLKKRLDRVNSADMVELKTMQKEVMRNMDVTSKGGSGLGLIDIAKKSEQSMEYDFMQIDEKFSFFILRIKVGIN